MSEDGWYGTKRRVKGIRYSRNEDESWRQVKRWKNGHSMTVADLLVAKHSYTTRRVLATGSCRNLSFYDTLHVLFSRKKRGNRKAIQSPAERALALPDHRHTPSMMPSRVHDVQATGK